MTAVSVAVAFGVAGCSTSFQLSALTGKDDPKVDHTASFAPMATPAKFDPTAEGDLALARAAAADLFARGSKDATAPWENPRTGARGTITPIATSYQTEGATCQDFLASYVRGERESWYQGGACRTGRKWEVRDLRPLRRS